MDRKNLNFPVPKRVKNRKGNVNAFLTKTTNSGWGKYEPDELMTTAKRKRRDDGTEDGNGKTRGEFMCFMYFMHFM